jgi:hypothetical protein
VKLGPTAELVDRTMIELSLANRPSGHRRDCADRWPAAILLVEFSGSDKASLLPKSRTWST